MSRRLILGAGGHAKVVADILQAQNQPASGYLDDNPRLWQQSILGVMVLGAISNYLDFLDTKFIIGIGANVVRFRIATQMEQQCSTIAWLTAIHPRATLAPSVSIGADTVVAAGAVINPDVVVGCHVIVNTSTSIDHDCTIGDYVHLAPGVHLAGGVRIGAGTLIGLGALITPYCTIGEGAVIGAGAVILHDIPANTTVVGVPGRILKQNVKDWPSS